MSKNEINTALEAAKAIADCIKDLGEVPSGHLYARLMGAMSLSTYQAIIELLKHANLITVSPSHLIKLVGRK